MRKPVMPPHKFTPEKISEFRKKIATHLKIENPDDGIYRHDLEKMLVDMVRTAMLPAGKEFRMNLETDTDTTIRKFTEAQQKLLREKREAGITERPRKAAASSSLSTIKTFGELYHRPRQEEKSRHRQ